VISPKADKSIYSEQCNWESVAREVAGSRRLYQKAYSCNLLSQFNIEHAGIFSAHFPYEILRVNQSGTFVLSCLEGEGLVKIDGNWICVKAGEACVFPPYTTNAFKAVEGIPWKFAWVRYEEPEDKKSIANTTSPVVCDSRPETIAGAVIGLMDELENTPSRAVVSCWVNLLHQQVQKIAVPQKKDERLVRMLKEVAKDLAKEWTLTELARISNLSEEHLRRLSNKQFGRSPMQQITFLRVSHAKNLIVQTDESIESIALKVGYKSQFSFSNTFKKWIGCRPSALR